MLLWKVTLKLKKLTMHNLKQAVNTNINRANFRKQYLLNKDPDNISAIRYWDGYITALASIVSVLPDDQYEEFIDESENLEYED